MMELLFVHTLLFAILVLVYVTSVFLIASFIKNNSIMDIAYGPAFLVGAVGSMSILHHANPLSILITLVIFVWSIRLSIRIWHKNQNKPEDPRYAKWREEWSRQGKRYFYLRSYLQIYLLQGSIIVAVALPFIISLTSADPTIPTLVYLGIGLAFFGLLYETTADWQLDQFLDRKKAGAESAVLMTTGLFRYSRRPNYFGETLVWWGLAITVLQLPLGYLALISPLLITYIVTKVTGPMLENFFLERHPKEYKAYVEKTSYFIPWFRLK
ncbi:MAG: DUF1295 domain-containing protein [Candidatus Paceibacteria bacterium]